MRTGRIKNKVEDRGFGFIESGGQQFFFHRSGCITPFDDLVLQDEVQFVEENSAKGPRATEVERV